MTTLPPTQLVGVLNTLPTTIPIPVLGEVVKAVDRVVRCVKELDLHQLSVSRVRDQERCEDGLKTSGVGEVVEGAQVYDLEAVLRAPRDVVGGVRRQLGMEGTMERAVGGERGRGEGRVFVFLRGRKGMGASVYVGMSVASGRNGLGGVREQRRTFFTRRMSKVELEADEGMNAVDPRKQAGLYKELLRQSPSSVIHRYEVQPQLPPVSSRYSASQRAVDVQRIQSDPECVKLYVQALGKEGRWDMLGQKLSASHTSNLAHPSHHSHTSVGMGDMSSPISTGPTNLIGEPREHRVWTNPDAWNRALSSSRRRTSSMSQSASSPHNMQPPLADPIQVIISEAWSWSKFTRKLGSKVLYALLLMTGLGVLLDQQGIIKGGMSTAEFEPNQGQTIKFADVQGVDEAKHELEEIVAFLKDPSKFREVGGKLPKGILLYGPPGTGKTHLARAIAGEASVPFFQMSGSEFDELYVGVGARRVRELFAAAKKRAPCIVFIDEIDAVGSKRSAKDQSYMRQTLNQLLVELDGFSSSEGVIFIAATNTPEALDKALVRPGRLDRLVPVQLPDVTGRTKILQVHLKNIAYSPELDPSLIARGTPGFSGADLANLVNLAAIHASKMGRRRIDQQDLEYAKDKILMGSERKSAVITPKNKLLTAYHEGGHTLCALYTPGASPLHKVTVIPRGNALGVTVQLPESDKTNYTRRELRAMLDVCMGGRVAEEVIFGKDEVTTGASSDLEKATGIAREMVEKYGMAEGGASFAMKDGGGLVKWDAWEGVSEESRRGIEGEVKKLLAESYERASKLIVGRRRELERLADALMEYETLEGQEVKTVVEGKRYPPIGRDVLPPLFFSLFVLVQVGN
ncbi:peptidase family M41-domain-containing protein [Gaertneriomyces semiglobifer]|nr:peptidase family M41-domain-containing protein [Gaertneriomyces semiglobifer]